MPINLFNDDYVVWSDDGEAQFTLREHYATKLFRGPAETDFEWSDGHADGRRIFERTGDIPEVNTDAAFYMRSEGYVLVQWYGSAPLMAYDDQGGGLLWSWNDGWMDDWAAPSPDGATVAALASAACYPDCPEPGETRVALIDASTGITQHTLDLPLVDVDFSTVSEWATWTPAGDLLVRTGGTSVTAVAPDGTASPADLPGCWYPVTTSSPWNADGMPAAEDNPAEHDWDGNHRPAQAFGCQ